MMYLSEKMLIKDFKKTFKRSFLTGNNYLLFEEVKTSWGIVDVLAINFNEEKLLKRKNKLRGRKISKFTNIMSYAITYVIKNPYLSIEELGKHLKIRNGLLLETVENLNARGLIHCYKNNRLRAKSVTENYVINEISAFEAKLNNWRQAVNQAERHLWFTNSTYVVFPELSPNVSNKVKHACTEKGIGLIVKVNNSFEVLKNPLYKKHIDSIISWKMNEAIVEGSKFND